MLVENALVNGDSQRFWGHAAEGRLVFQLCQRCEAVQHPPRLQCAKCWHDDLDEVTSSGLATIESITIVRRAPLAEFKELVPYVVVAVVVDEGPRMITNLVGENALAASIGDRVSVVFEPDLQGRVLPQFKTDQTTSR